MDGCNIIRLVYLTHPLAIKSCDKIAKLTPQKFRSLSTEARAQVADIFFHVF